MPFCTKEKGFTGDQEEKGESVRLSHQAWWMENGEVKETTGSGEEMKLECRVEFENTKGRVAESLLRGPPSDCPGNLEGWQVGVYLARLCLGRIWAVQYVPTSYLPRYLGCPESERLNTLNSPGEKTLQVPTASDEYPASSYVRSYQVGTR